MASESARERAKAVVDRRDWPATELLDYVAVAIEAAEARGYARGADDERGAMMALLTMRSGIARGDHLRARDGE